MADKKQEDKKKKSDASWISEAFGGLLGNASSAVKSRNDKNRDALEQAEGKRPPPSKKWVE